MGHSFLFVSFELFPHQKEPFFPKRTENLDKPGILYELQKPEHLHKY